MKTVRIIKNWDTPDIFRQTPNRRGVWKDIFFTQKPIESCDYVLVLNYSPENEKVYCPKENIWCIHQEPHNEYFAVRHKYTSKVFSRVFTTDTRLQSDRYVHSHGCLPWHIDKSYDELVKISIPRKLKTLSCISSSKTNFFGHKSRLVFLDHLKNKLFFDLYGFGINPVKDKWDALAPYKYSLVLENFSGPNYWSEKLSDSFLSWTMPIYYGCTNISDYFPKDSFVNININSADALEVIVEIVNSDLYKKNRDAIAYARELVLTKYQFFPFFESKIHEWEKKLKNKVQNSTVNIIPSGDTTLMNIFLKIKRIPYYFFSKSLYAKK